MLLISSSLFLALFLTILIEVVLAFFFGFRKKIEIITIVFVNLFTNPALNYLLLINSRFSLFKNNLVLVLFLEILVVVVEWRLLVFAFKEEQKRLLVLSIIMNFCSYIVGVLFFK